MTYRYRSGGRLYQNHRAPTRQYSSRRSVHKNYIDPLMFIKAASQVEVDSFVPLNSFSDFSVHNLLLTNIQAKNYTAPSPIQDQAIPHGLSGQDVIGIANTGTGKTLAFAVPILHSLLTGKQERVLILAPTRELAIQIEEECKMLAKGSGLFGALLIGGSSMGAQLHDLRNCPSIVIGTPGRIKDHIQRGSLQLSDFTKLVLDEVDRMLDMGFVNVVRFIIGNMPADRQSFFFTATLDSKVNELIQEFSRNPITVSVKTGETTDMVDQDIIKFTSKTDRLERLHNLLLEAPKSLVFVDTKYSVESLTKELQARGFRADAIHGGKTQYQRQRVLGKFKANELSVLIATDVAARGIDIGDISHVINFSVPHSYDDYVHRIGRTGRAGKTGVALTFIEA